MSFQHSDENGRIAEAKALAGCTHGIVTFTRGCIICGDPAFATDVLAKVEAALAAEPGVSEAEFRLMKGN